MEQIPDHIRPNLKVLFIGFNPSLKSGETGHHYANPNNRFWSILCRAGLTPEKLKPAEDSKLLDYGYGLTNIVARPTKAAADLSKEEYAEGRDELKAKIKRYKPQIACFVGKGVYQQFSSNRNVSWGVQPESVVPGVTEFVAPSSSGLVRMKMDEIVAIYSELTRLIV
ncbi:MAG TPA: G/U mismatch-specific DNA glycosylase [Bacillales bacterium]|nr:G/U mismatch-specific DNA glycosylase [Bacillales bacterium]